MWEDPIVAEVRKAREEIMREHGYSLDSLIKDLQRTQAEHTSKDGRYMPPDDESLKVAEELPEYKTGND
ncbi:MAG: hypothetical protein DRP64_17050 [Verrucomicrobia bacterium]|nr:MAG: hypothetical protein DRP64_17050 [Verrucomicrobiota bacterium]